MKKKKVVIHLPAMDLHASKKTGFLTKAEIRDIENKLSKNPTISFLGNINFNNLKVIGNDFCCDDVNLSCIDLFFWYAPGMKKNMDELKALSKIIKVIKSPDAFTLVDDKFKAHSLLKINGFPVADFALIRWDDLEMMKEIMKSWKIVLIKPRSGSFGRGILKAENFETLRDVAGMLMLEHKQEKIFVEKFYENDKNGWISTTLINRKVIYGYRKREEKFADWKVYDLKAEGKGAYYVDSSPVKKFAEKAVAILDNSIVGFDFIKTSEGYKIVDENNFPGFYPEAFENAGKNVSNLIIDLIASA